MSEHSCGSGCGCGPKTSTSSMSSQPPLAASESSTGRVTVQNGKGSGPRNISKTFLNNYEGIRWSSGGKKRKEGTKFVKTY